MVKYGRIKIEVEYKIRMIYTLRVSTLALLDIEDAIFWYELHQKGLGGSIKDKLFEGLEYISQ